ncbi:hypothetical protein THMIRHAM_17580 [Thiomicrorhabdus immobilis]|uniref:Flp family type IVb pilin n=1 Tax=Thiomicrorhabdus immobilis TaxID=2791037 RepID=A0ABN6CY16_9GAMM|nr:Flp family type IVb pilin [Thiomicrorhabdus immobilis]BCN93973.1 hypothetical protein THMIRHAM_17580 [Thiomicrorhabdus immobilis]
MVNEQKVIEMIKTKQVKKQKGASMIEYALVVAAVVAVAALFFKDETVGIGKAINDKLTTVSTNIAS